MLKIGDKTFLNLQEAVAWLMENNCIPFQCTAPYAANTEIGMGTIVNPSPAKVRIGSIIFFSDSKVSTVTGITQNGFMVSDEYNDLVDDVVYVKNVAIAGNGHLIVTLSNDDAIDAGLIKQVSGFSIDGLQHLVVSYNDGTTQDLGAIFNGNVNIAGNFTADSIIENMPGYSFTKENGVAWTAVFAGVVKNGNKVTFTIFGSYTNAAGDNDAEIAYFSIPSSVGTRLYPYTLGAVINVLDQKSVAFFKNTSARSAPIYATVETTKNDYSRLNINIRRIAEGSFEVGSTYVFRYEVTFLLSQNLAS